MGNEELAKQLVTYADAITAFAFVQSAAFGFALGQREFRDSTLKAPYLGLGLLALAYAFYTWFIFECRRGVAALLSGPTHMDPVLMEWTNRIWCYRFGIIGLAAFLSAIAMILTMVGAHFDKDHAPSSPAGKSEPRS